MTAQGPPRAAVAAGSGGATGESADSGANERASLALQHAVAHLGAKPGFVLDLGSAAGSNISFFSELACKVFIADLNNSLFGAVRQSDRAEALDRALSDDIPTHERFDLVLLWDLLDYLDDSEIRILGARLRPFCRDSTALYSLISIRKEIPDRPCRYEIRGRETILYVNETPLQRQAPLHKEPELAKLLPDFEVESSHLLRHGRMEYIFRTRRGD